MTSEITPDPSTELMTAYVNALLEKNKQLNLTGTKTFEAAWKLHVEDSRAIETIAGLDPKVAVDLGSGNGFPGVFIAAKWPNARVVLVERIGKKARALEELAAEAGLDNVEVAALDGAALISRYPELARMVDLVTARAVTTLSKMVPLCTPWLSRKGRMVFWKSQKVDEELRLAQSLTKDLRLHPLSRHDYEIEGFRGGCLIVGRKWRKKR